MSKIRVGMIGTGGISQLHGRQLLELKEAEITALCDQH
jgi:predicted dehydrogenase